jgi:gliding motility-associated lipoprotein GldH
MRTKSFLKTSLLLLAVLFFAACDSKRVFEQNTEIPNNVWNVKNVVKFDVDVNDIKTPTNFYVNVRNADGFPYSNLYLYIKTTMPNGQISNDTLECVLADETGKWLGNGMGDIYDNQIPFKRNVRFPVTGKYTFEMQHGMRVEDLPLIMDVGLRIEKAGD